VIEVHPVQFSAKLPLSWSQEKRELKSTRAFPQISADISPVLQSLSLISASPHPG